MFCCSSFQLLCGTFPPERTPDLVIGFALDIVILGIVEMPVDFSTEVTHGIKASGYGFLCVLEPRQTQTVRIIDLFEGGEPGSGVFGIYGQFGLTEDGESMVQGVHTSTASSSGMGTGT
jgi:hypothetical protein